MRRRKNEIICVSTRVDLCRRACVFVPCTRGRTFLGPDRRFRVELGPLPRGAVLTHDAGREMRATRCSILLIAYTARAAQSPPATGTDARLGISERQVLILALVAASTLTCLLGICLCIVGFAACALAVGTSPHMYRVLDAVSLARGGRPSYRPMSRAGRDHHAAADVEISSASSGEG